MNRLLSLLALVGINGAQAALVSLSLGDSAIGTTEDNFICVNMDWWPTDKCDYEGDNGRTHKQACSWAVDGVSTGTQGCSIINQDLSQPRLVNALRALSNAGGRSGTNGVSLRLGGSLSDWIRYDVPGAGNNCTAGDIQPKLDPNVRLGFMGGCLKADRWDALHAFAREARADVYFGINALIGRHMPNCTDPTTGKPYACWAMAEAHHNKSKPAPPACCTTWHGDWDPSQAAALLRYTYNQGHVLAGVEYGNELTGKGGIQAQLDPLTYAKGFQELRREVDNIWPVGASGRPLLIASDSAFDEEWTREFLHEEPRPDVFTTHMYTLGPGVNYQKAQASATRPSSLDKLHRAGVQANTTVGAKARLWVGEAGGAYNSGAPNVTDGFVSAFWYLDNMAMLATTGYRAFCRQTLLGGNYELLGSLHFLRHWFDQMVALADHNTYEPNPDYWAALLWRQLMGHTILDATSDDASLRAYASCTPDAHGNNTGGVTFLLLNLHNAQTTISLPAAGDQDLSNVWNLEAAAEPGVNLTERLRTRKVLLNGALLQVSGDTFPSLHPKHVTGAHIILEPMSYAFVVIPAANQAACLGEAPPAPPVSPTPSPTRLMDKKAYLIVGSCVAILLVVMAVVLIQFKRRRAAAQRRASAWLESPLDKPLDAPLANSAQW